MNAKTKKWSESHVRSILKAFSWRVLATLTTMTISYFVTGSLKYAFAIGSIEVFTKIFLYYFHERIWSQILRYGVRVENKNNAEKAYL